MANPTPTVITKDLGLVTAYGYALAGGYQGTEQQFIHDFTELMAGHYSGSQLTTESSTDLFSSSYSSHVYTDMCVYGNISFLTADLTTNASIEIPTSLQNAPVLYGVTETDLDARRSLLKYVWCSVHAPTIASNKYAGVIGFDDNARINIPRGACPAMYTAGQVTQSGVNSTIIECRLYNYSNATVTIPSNTRILISSMFFNKVGMTIS